MTGQTEAKGIHDHESMKLGRRPPKGAPAIKLADVLTGAAVPHAVAADHFNKVQFGLYENDRFGVCGPTGVANLVRLISSGLLGTAIVPSQDDAFDLYRRSGNPGFDPTLPADDPKQEDNGVDLQTMLEALVAGGIGDGKGGKLKPVCFAKVDVDSPPELDAMVAIFGGGLWGVDLETAQQPQSQAKPPKWDYKRSSQWGGHCVMNGKYDETAKLADVISWAMDVETTDAFRSHQLGEAWVVVWPWNLAHPAFQQGIDLTALENAFKSLTGSKMPTTSKVAGDGSDDALWAAVEPFVASRAYGRAHEVQDALRSWAYAKGYKPSV